MRFRWSDGRGAAVEFTAIDAEGLARVATDAAIDFRRETVQRGGEGGGASYPSAQLHVHVGIAWSFPTDRRLHAPPHGGRAPGEGAALRHRVRPTWRSVAAVPAAGGTWP